MLDRLFPGRREKRQLRAIREAAAAHSPSESVLVIGRASPDAAHYASRQVFGTVSFALDVVRVAPLVVKPHEISLRLEGCFNAQMVCSCSISNRAIVANFESAERTHRLAFEEKLLWMDIPGFKIRLPEQGDVMSCKVAGQLTLLGPWDGVYGVCKFADSFWIGVSA